MSYGKIFPLWRAGAGTYWPAYSEHAFVQGLADGSLPRAAFLHYLVQDYIFLMHFSRAWALGVTKAGTVAEMRHCAATVNALMNDETALHVQLCAREGISEAELFAAEERPENIAYTRYVLDAGHSGDFLDLLATLVPCVLGYGEIGARLLPTQPTGPYAEWIAMYGGEEYQQVCHDVGALLDAAVESRMGSQPEQSPRWGALVQRFTMAARLEAGFWDMGLTP